MLLNNVEKLLEDAKNLKVNFSIDLALQKIFDRYRWPLKYQNGQPTIEIILEDGNKTDVLFSFDGYVNPNVVLDYYNKGYTVLLSRVQTLHPEIIKLAKIVNEYCNSEVNINMYFGKGTSSVSFKEHTHEYAVLVKSVEGESEWVIDGEKIVVMNQDAIYFDSYVTHAVTKITKPKLTLTCNLIKVSA